MTISLWSLSDGVSAPRITPAKASTAAGEGLLATLKAREAELDTVTSAAKPEVSLDGSVAVALTK